MGHHVKLSIKPKKSTLYTSSFAKLATGYCGTFQLLEKVGPISYKLALLSPIKIHNVFHVSLLKKYIHDPTHVIDWNVIQVEPEGEFLPEPLHILAREEIELWNRTVARVKVQWKHFSPEEATWEREEDMKEKYPSLFEK